MYRVKLGSYRETRLQAGFQQRLIQMNSGCCTRGIFVRTFRCKNTFFQPCAVFYFSCKNDLRCRLTHIETPQKI